MDRAFLLYVRQGQFLRVIGTDATGLSPRIHSKAFKPVGKLKSRSGMPVAERFEEQCDAWPIGLGHLEGERTNAPTCIRPWPTSTFNRPNGNQCNTFDQTPAQQ